MNKDFTQIENKKLASPWRRFCAYNVDSFIVGIITIFIYSISVILFPILSFSYDKDLSFAYTPAELFNYLINFPISVYNFLFITLVSFLVYLYVCVYLPSKTGQSWGGEFMGLYILSDNKKFMSPTQSFVRYFLSFIEQILIHIGISTLLSFFRKDKKTLIDVVVKTNVYMIDSEKYESRTVWVLSLSILLLCLSVLAIIVAYNIGYNSH